MGRLILAVLLLGATTGCDLGGAVTPTPAAPAASAAVIAVSGPAFACAQTTGCATPATVGSRIFTNGEARTDPGSTLNLESPTTAFRLEEQATLQFKAVTDAVTQITLAAGRLFVRHNANGKDQITIQAGDVRVDTLDLGSGMPATNITVVMSDTAVYVGVPDGSSNAQVTLANGQTMTLQESFTLTIPDSAQQFPPPVLMDAVEQGRWDHFSPQLQPTPFVPGTSTPDQTR
jgi:hypothetical protein